MPITKFYIFKEFLADCSVMSLYEKPITDITEETTEGVYAKLYRVDGECATNAFQYENIDKTIAKVIFYKTEQEVKEWERAQQVTLRELSEKDFNTLAESTSTYNVEKQAIKTARNNEIDNASIETKNGFKVDGNDLSLNRLTAISVSAIYVILQQLADSNKTFKTALNSIKDIKIPYKDSDNNLQEISILDVMEIQKNVLQNLSDIFIKYEEEK